MRYVYAVGTAVLLGGTALALTSQVPVGAQVAQNEQAQMARVVPRSGAPASFADLVEQLQPAVVNISTRDEVEVGRQINPFGGSAPVVQEQEGGGSGFLISADGYIVTNNHVVSGQSGRAVNAVTITMTDRREFRARIVGRDPTSDLALLKIDATGLPFVKFGDSRKARVGDWVVAIGNPFGIGSTVTSGIISALQRTTGMGGAYDRYIQTDTAINRGNSGGPLFDLNGNVLGITNMLISPVGANIGINFAIPADAAVPVIEALKRGAAPQRGYLGIGIVPVDDVAADAMGIPNGRGEIVQRVEAGEAAEKAGIRRGDVVLSVNGQEVTPDNSLSYIVSNTAPGTRIPIVVMRDGRRVTLNATVAQRPPEDKLNRAPIDPESEGDGGGTPEQGSAERAVYDALGLQVQTLDSTLAQRAGVPAGTRGAVVLGIDRSADAVRRGIRPGLVIVGANGRDIANAAGLASAVADAKRAGRDAIVLDVLGQRGQRALVPVRLR